MIDLILNAVSVTQDDIVEVKVVFLEFEGKLDFSVQDKGRGRDINDTFEFGCNET